MRCSNAVVVALLALCAAASARKLLQCEWLAVAPEGGGRSPARYAQESVPPSYWAGGAAGKGNWLAAALSEEAAGAGWPGR